MKFYDLKNPKNKVSFKEALFTGTSEQGGLYFPESIPTFTEEELSSLLNCTFAEVASVTLGKWLGGELPESELRGIVERAFDFELLIKSIGPYKVLELFHGPTMAFKDIAARFLAECMSYYLAKENECINIIVATSGDTGGAVASAFANKPGIKVYILFPKGKISRLQRLQLTRVAKNIHPIEVDSDFDACQALVKSVLADPSLSDFTTANSINIGRLLPQTCYYVYAYLQIGKYEAVIPTGNLGNATAAFMAKEMLAGPSKIVLACNSNDSLKKYSNTGIFEATTSKPTLSNAMDVGTPNNFARYLALASESIVEFNKITAVESIGDDETVEMIKRIYNRYEYLVDPHTAVGFCAANKHKASIQQLIVATASPLKFSEEIQAATGIEVDNKYQLQKLESDLDRSKTIANDYTKLQAQL